MRVKALMLLWTQAGLAAEVQGMLVRRDLNACVDKRLWFLSDHMMPPPYKARKNS